jgi:hypothetical protein
MDEQGGPNVARSVEFETDATVTSSVVAAVRARDVHLTNAAAGMVAADGNVSILNGGCGPVVASGGVTIRNGGCGPVITGGDVSFTNGGTQSVMAAGAATIGPNGYVGLVVSPKVTLADGGRVLFSTREALVFGAAAGTVAVVLSRLFRRR